MPKISVIIPVYKVEIYLNKCIESILNQTFIDFELILVDDGSPDNCPLMCDEWAKKDNRIKVIHQTNQGVSVARNNGLNASIGKYIAFVDSDDWIAENYLDILYSNIITYDADISVCSMTTIKQDNIIHDSLKYNMNNTIVLKNKQLFYHFANLNNYKFRTIWGKLVKKDIAVKYKFPSNRSYGEDLAVLYKWYDDALIAVDTSMELYYYNVRISSITNVAFGPHKFGAISTREELIAFLDKKKYYDLKEFFIFNLCDYISMSFRDAEREENKECCKYLKKKLTEVLKKYKHSINFSIKKIPDCYNILYPLRAIFYWKIKSFFIKRNE